MNWIIYPIGLSGNMGVLEQVVDYLKGIPGVVEAFPIDDDLAHEIDHIERSICTTSNHSYRNVGYDDAMGRECRICVLHTLDYFFNKRAIVKLRTSDGTVMGTTLYPYEIPAYKRMENVIWLSDDFVIFTNTHGSGTEEFIVTSFDIPEISQEIPECCGVIGSSPTMSSDMLLKSKRGISPTNDIYSTIVAFDIIERQAPSLSVSPLLRHGGRISYNHASVSVDPLPLAISAYSIPCSPHLNL